MFVSVRDVRLDLFIQMLRVDARARRRPAHHEHVRRLLRHAARLRQLPPLPVGQSRVPAGCTCSACNAMPIASTHQFEVEPE